MTTPPTMRPEDQPSPPPTLKQASATYDPRGAQLGRPLYRPRFFMMTSLGFGHLRPFPGTWGSLPPLGIAAVLVLVGAGPTESPWVFNGVCLLMVLVWSLVCVLQGERAEAYWRTKDPSSVTADEAAGMALALIALPLEWGAGFWSIAAWLIGAFVLFRLFDIVKPWPIEPLQRIPGGLGILLDDLAAGAATLIVLQLWAATMS
ncbi:MAG: phosphatidylglycerophosphatase A [Phycisphaeraceae bacterium]|nr:phosphatidylglycerophosphatase A [Phycisphaeraceae bacterium]MCW5755516.1 phosphatidylglycerophosphatase A [Phycisphaeraceae bacterium]